MTTCFVYKWTHIPTMMWYIGSRTANGCHINDGYITSSKVVLEMYNSAPDEWKREIIDTGTANAMIDREAEILNLLDAKNDFRSFNRHNGDGKFTSTGKIVTEATRKKMSDNRKSLPKSGEHKEKISKSLRISLRDIKRPNRYGKKAPHFKYYCVTPDGRTMTATEASKEFNVTPETIRNWSKLKKNGWNSDMAKGETV